MTAARIGIDPSECTAEKHNTWSVRSGLCNCTEGLEYRRRQMREYEKKRYLNGGQQLRRPKIGVIRRKQALAWMGWSEQALAEELGKYPPKARAAKEHVSPDTFAWWAEAFEKFHNVPGPSNRARSMAITKGWAPPLAWLDIDDPEDTPGIRDNLLEEGLRRRRAARRRTVAQRQRRLARAGLPVPTPGSHRPVMTVTQYRRYLEQKAEYMAARRKKEQAA